MKTKVTTINYLLPNLKALLDLSIKDAPKDSKDLDPFFKYYIYLNESFPDEKGVNNILGVLHYLKGDLESAYSLFIESRDVLPEFYWAHHNAAIVASRLYRSDHAIAHIKSALSNNPSHTLNIISRSKAYVQILNAAEGRVDPVDHLKSGREQMYLLLAINLFLEKHYDAVVKVGASSIQNINHENPGMHLMVGLSLMHLADYDNALLFLRKASLLNPDLTNINDLMEKIYSYINSTSESRNEQFIKDFENQMIEDFMSGIHVRLF